MGAESDFGIAPYPAWPKLKIKETYVILLVHLSFFWKTGNARKMNAETATK